MATQTSDAGSTSAASQLTSSPVVNTIQTVRCGYPEYSLYAAFKTRGVRALSFGTALRIPWILYANLSSCQKICWKKLSWYLCINFRLYFFAFLWYCRSPIWSLPMLSEGQLNIGVPGNPSIISTPELPPVGQVQEIKYTSLPCIILCFFLNTYCYTPVRVPLIPPARVAL